MKRVSHIFRHVTLLTQGVGGRAFEDEAVCGEEDGSLRWKKSRPSHQPCCLIASVGNQMDPHPVHHELLSWQESGSQQLGLHRQTEEEGPTVITGSGVNNAGAN